MMLEFHYKITGILLGESDYGNWRDMAFTLLVYRSTSELIFRILTLQRCKNMQILRQEIKVIIKDII
jgi:hypothetical protein